jgi:hypothetical protein
MKTKFSPVLQQNITIDTETKSIITEDGTDYNSYELNLLQESSDTMKRCIHKLKFLFNGEVTEPPREV